MAEPTVAVELTEEECRAIHEFFSYGATRGNHDERGAVPGPLTKWLWAMSNANRKVYEAAHLAF